MSSSSSSSSSSSADRLSEHSVPNTSTPSPHLYGLFEEAVSKYGSKEAILSLHQPPHLYADSLNIEPSKGPGLRWTYDNIHRAATRFSYSLEANGVKKGDAVTTFLENGIECCVALWACWRIGAIFAPMSIRMLQNAEEIKYMFQASGVRVLIVANAETAARVDELAGQAGLALKLKVVTACSGAPDSWMDFSSLIKASVGSDGAISKMPAAQLADTDCAVICFTSGTTSFPKGCQHSHGSLATILDKRRPLWKVDPETRTANFLPNNHMMGLLFTVPSLISGGCVVYPAGVFTPAAVLDAFTKEGCNETMMVPTMLYALINIMSEQNIPRLDNVRCVGMGGASVSQKNLEDASVRLGSSLVCSAYGMSEGFPMRPVLFKTAAEGVIQDSPCCGEVSSGCTIKICSPGTTKAIPINTPGELHMSGPSVITGYLGGRNKEDFYDEDGKRWFKSGDQAVMDEQHRIAIVGRYKDMIIRGGENIAPSAMERVLNTIDGIEVYVVGAEDEIAGEVPVIVYAGRSTPTKTFQELCLERMGPSHVPDASYHLSDLKLSEFPKNLTGKVVKDQLAQIVKKHRASIAEPQVHAEKRAGTKPDGTSHVVTVIWASLVGIRPEDLDPEAQTASFADSINMMRFRQRIKQETGKILTVEQVLGSTIAEQIRIIDNQATPSNSLPARPATEYHNRPGGPSAVDMVHCYGDEERAAATRKVVEKVLGPHGLSWDNVSEVFPAWGNGQAIFTQKRDLSWDFRFFIPTKVKDRKAVRAALEAALEKNPNHLSFFVREDGSVTNRKSLGLHVNLKPSRDIFDSIISYAPKPLKTVAELHQYWDDHRLDVGFDSLTTRAEIVHVTETDTAYIILNVNHVTFDAMSVAGLLLPDLDLALSDPLLLKDHTPYKIFADTYYSLSTSHLAQQDVKFHVSHLRDITSHKNAATWPPQRAPDWVLGPRRGWIAPPADAPQAGYSNPAGLPLEEDPSRRCDGGSAPVAWRGELPGLNAFRESVGAGLTNPAIAKAALALLNVRHTGDTHALFSSLDTGRASLPFVPASLGGALAAAGVTPADMTGPMFQRIANLIRVDRAETVGGLLRRVQELQDGQTRHCHAPLNAVCEALGPEGGDMVLGACRRQLLNWAPGVGAMDWNPFKNIELLDSRTRGDIGLIFFVGTGGKAGQDFVLKVVWDDANVTRSEAEKWRDEYKAMIEWIVRSGKDRLVGEVFDLVNGAAP